MRTTLRTSCWVAAAKIAVSIGLLYLVARGLDTADLRATLVRLPAGAFALGVVLFMAQTLVLALRWRLVMDAIGPRLPFGRVLSMVFIGGFFNQVLPTSFGGDAMRVWHAHHAGLQHEPAIVGVLLERVTGVVGLTLMVAFGMLALGPQVDNAALRAALVATLPLALVGSAALAALDRLPAPLRRHRALRDLVRLAAYTRRIFLGPRHAVPLLLLSFLSNALAALAVVAFARGLELELPLWPCLVLVPAAVLVTIIPVSFAGWGLREGAMVTLLGSIGVAPDAALALSVAFGLALLTASLPGSALWLAWHGRAREGAAP